MSSIDELFIQDCEQSQLVRVRQRRRWKLDTIANRTDCNRQVHFWYLLGMKYCTPPTTVTYAIIQ